MIRTEQLQRPEAWIQPACCSSHPLQAILQLLSTLLLTLRTTRISIHSSLVCIFSRFAPTSIEETTERRYHLPGSGKTYLPSSMMMVSPRTLALPDPDIARYHDGRHTVSASAGASPSSGWPRKRAASIDMLEGDNVKSEQAWKAGSSNSTKNDQRDHVCLCTSDPKIPRPRNGTNYSRPQVGQAKLLPLAGAQPPSTSLFLPMVA